MTAFLNLKSENRCFGGTVGFYSHHSETCNGNMRFAVYQPPQATSEPVPVLYFLSGLASTEENFMVKAGAQRFAAKYGLMLVAPDTSPRDTGIAGENDDWDLGTGASFYVDATVEPWRSHYQMYSYVVHELPAVIAEHFPVQAQNKSIFGHSMGGHGALVCALKNPELYKSVSAFAPIAAPMRCPWGQKAFTHYLGSDEITWRTYDASVLVGEAQFNRSILIDQGAADPFLTKQLMPNVFEQTCEAVGQPLNLRFHEGYDHSYFFISTLIEDHIRHHYTALHE